MTCATDTSDLAALGDTVTNIGTKAIRFSSATVLGWIGATKFTAYEAGAIEGLVASSPLTNWLYSVFRLQGGSNLIGSVEIVIALLLVAGARLPRLRARLSHPKTTAAPLPAARAESPRLTRRTPSVSFVYVST